MPFGYACDRCRQKHQSCDHQFPCQRCIKANSEDACHYTPKRPRSRKGSSSSCNAYSVVVNSGFLGGAGGVDSNSGGRLCLLGNGTTTSSLLGANNSLHLSTTSSSNPDSQHHQQQHIHHFQSLHHHQHIHSMPHYPASSASNNVHHQSFNRGQNAHFHQRANAAQQQHSTSLPPHPLHLHHHQQQQQREQKSFSAHQHQNQHQHLQHRMSTGSWSGEFSSSSSSEAGNASSTANSSSAAAQMIYLSDAGATAFNAGFPLVGAGVGVSQPTARTSSSSSSSAAAADSVYSNDILLLENELFSRDIIHSTTSGVANSIYACNSAGARNASVPACFPSSELLDGIHYSTSKLYEAIPEPYARYYGYDSSALLASGVFMQEYMREAINFINDDIRLAEGSVSCGGGIGSAGLVAIGGGGTSGTILSPSSVASTLNGTVKEASASVESVGSIFGELTSASNGGSAIELVVGEQVDGEDDDFVIGRSENCSTASASASASCGQNIPPNGGSGCFSSTSTKLTMIGTGGGNHSLNELRSSGGGGGGGGVSNSTSLSHL